MSKITLPTLESGYLSTEKLNEAFQTIEAAFDNTVSRDGSSPNQLTADLDLNGYTLLNTSLDVTDPNSLLTYQTMIDYVTAQAAGVVIQKIQTIIATSGQTVFVLTDFEYSPGSNNLAVFVDGVRQFVTLDYAETDATTVTFLAGVSLNAEVTFVSNEFLGTVNLPAHTHTWAQITGKPDTATRWPDWTEVTGKPTTFTPAAHNQDASTITTGRLADARRGVYVQDTQPTANTVGELWFY